MLFTSPLFLIFFVVVFGLYLLPLGWRSRKWILLAASLVFYAAWNPPFVLLLLFSIGIDYYLGNWLHAAQRPRLRKALVVCSVVINLGVLCVFKYAEFLRESTVVLFAYFGVLLELAPYSIILPVGISFYTFQSMSYTIDVYRREIAPCRSLPDFALFVSFFPQLVAGPIVRASEFLSQLETPRQVNARQVAWGGMLFIVGLFKKVFLADGIFAGVANLVYLCESKPGFVESWVGTYAFAGQIFCDFSGYSDMAIGLAMAMGFVLPDNFRAPYAAAGFSDFWRRWHMTLSRWLRDYLYIPMGGSRHGALRTSICLAVTMLLGGLWHGANWTFVAWGGLHGAFLALERFFRGGFLARWLVASRLARLLAMLVTFHGVCLAWVLFRAESIAGAAGIYSAMTGSAAGAGIPRLTRWDMSVAMLAMAGLWIVQVWLRGIRLEQLAERVPRWVLASVAAIMLFLVLTSGGRGIDFIYFAF